MSRMRRAASLDEFAEQPAGSYLAGRSWAHACPSPELYLLLFWGRALEDDMQALVRSLALELRPNIPRHASLVEAGRIEGVDSGAFAVLNAYVREQHEGLSRAVSQLALVRPGGMPGAIVAGFFEVLAPPYPVKVFDAPEPAITWLAGERAAEYAQRLQSLVSQLIAVDPLVGELRTLMLGRLVDVDLPSAAKKLGLSERTLQRRLHGAGTSFARELLSARLDEAQRRMLDSSAPLTNIALDVGFASLQHFSAIFRRELGEAPSAWRERRAQTAQSMIGSELLDTTSSSSKGSSS